MKRHLKNSLWFMGQSVLTQALLFFVTATVARYLGAGSFGVLTYVLAVAAILAVFGQLGLDNLLIRELVGRDADEKEILGTGAAVRAAASLAASFSMVAFGYFVASSPPERQLFYIAALFFPSIPLLMPALWLQAQERARDFSISQMLGQCASAALKITLVLSAADLVVFGLGNATQALVAATFAYYFSRLAGAPAITEWRFSFSLAKKLVPEGWTFFLGALLGMIYLKIDIVMLRWMSGANEVGLYSVAAQISESFYFVPGAILAATFPAMVRLKDNGGRSYELRLRQIIDAMLWISVAAVVGISLVGYFAIPLIYGAAFAASSDILLLHVLAMPFVFMGTAFVRWLLVERLTKIILLTQGLGAAANVLLNLWLIPEMQGKGAALATVLSYIIAYYLSLVLHPQTRPIFAMMSSTLFIPWASARRAYALGVEFR